MFKLTAKRRENLVKFCVSTFTVDLAGLIMPFFLQAQKFPVSILLAGLILAVALVILTFLIEK